jgi:hypothetical protein
MSSIEFRADTAANENAFIHCENATLPGPQRTAGGRRATRRESPFATRTGQSRIRPARIADGPGSFELSRVSYSSHWLGSAAGPCAGGAAGSPAGGVAGSSAGGVAGSSAGVAVASSGPSSH